MNCWPVKLIRPTALLCMSLLLILLLLPDSSLVLGGKGHGKKKLTPVKHLFGVGIGYQRVVHYKPVLVFSKHRRPKKKKRRPGWGWGGGGGGHGKTGWSPVVVQHHIYKDDGHGHGHGHHRHGGGGSGYQHQHHHHHHHSEPPKRRTKSKSQYHHRPHRHGGAQSYRGWGWRSTTGPARRNPEAKTGGYHGGGYDFPHHSPPRHSYHHQPPTTDDDYGSPVAEWSPGYSHYGNPGLDYVDGDDAGGYETEIKEQWNNHNDRPLTPLVFPGTTVDSTSSSQQSNPPSPQSHIPPPYPFEDAPKSDTSVTNIRRDFLKNHLKNFREFKGYEDAHRNNEVPGGSPMMGPPGPNYSTTNMQGPQGAPPDQYYDDYFIPNDNNAPMSQHNAPDERERRPHKNNGPPPPDNYNYDVVDDDGFNWSELNRKMSANTQTTASPTPAPLVAQSQNIIYGVQGALPSTQNNVVVNAPVQANMQVNTTPMPNTRERFKPSQRIDDMGSGTAFNDPGFFPTFDQFREIRME